MYSPLNIYIALVGVVVWNQRNEIAISSSSDQTLTHFLEYRKNKLLKDHPNDNAQLITQMTFDGGIVGKAAVKAMCSPDNSGGVIRYHSSTTGLMAHTLAHEMGHNFGMEHDDYAHCSCDNTNCIMASFLSENASCVWSSCSLEYIIESFDQGLDYCLHNIPKRLFRGPVCGNGFVEDSEQCDCGLEEVCDNPCCDSSTCKMKPGAKCATGHCCDLQECDLKAGGTLCRSADRECDLPEFCTGETEYCPDDLFRDNGEACRGGEAFCYQGMCRTHDTQCQLLWGPSGRNGHDKCYELKSQCDQAGSVHKKCRKRDAVCSRLQCTRVEGDLQFGIAHDAQVNIGTIQNGLRSVTCAHVNLGVAEGEVDAGRVPDGAKCGEGQMCLNRKCVDVDRIKRCTSNCSGCGVCNNLGQCHCDLGFAPPECNTIGPGGSLDSGPAMDPDGNFEYVVSLYAIFLGIVPLLALVTLAIHINHHKSKNQGISIAATKMSGHSMNKLSFFRWHPRINHSSPRWKGRGTCGQQDSSPRPDISRRELLSTTNTAVLATLQVAQDKAVPSTTPATRTSFGAGGGRKFSIRTRKLSLSKGLSLRLAPTQNPMVRSLLEPSDSSGASTPDTPPTARALEREGPSVAQLAARFRADDDVMVRGQGAASKKPSRRPPQPPPQSGKPHFPRV